VINLTSLKKILILCVTLISLLSILVNDPSLFTIIVAIDPSIITMILTIVIIIIIIIIIINIIIILVKIFTDVIKINTIFYNQWMIIVTIVKINLSMKIIITMIINTIYF